MDHPETPAGAVPPASARLVLRGREVGRDGQAVRPVVMAVLNRTTDSFYAPARVPGDAAALAAAERAYADGAEILDVGGVRAGNGAPVDEAEEIRRVVPFVAAVRRAVPDLLVSVDTWRAGVARAAIDAGADLVNDTWAGHDPGLVEVAGAAGVGVVCSHTGGAVPRTDPYRVEYPDVGGGRGPRGGGGGGLGGGGGGAGGGGGGLGSPRGA
ncbi:dihydropteroate synthase, partial [Promicromonospora sukumoe]